MTPLEKLQAARVASAKRREGDRDEERASILAEHAWLRAENMLRTLRCDPCLRRIEKSEAVFFCRFEPVGNPDVLEYYLEYYCCASCASRPPWQSVVLARGGTAQGRLPGVDRMDRP